MILGEGLRIPIVGFICQPDHKIEESVRNFGGLGCWGMDWVFQRHVNIYQWYYIVQEGVMDDAYEFMSGTIDSGQVMLLRCASNLLEQIWVHPCPLKDLRIPESTTGTPKSAKWPLRFLRFEKQKRTCLEDEMVNKWVSFGFYLRSP